MSSQTDFAPSATAAPSDRLILQIATGALIALIVGLIVVAAHLTGDPSFPTNVPVWELGVGYP